MSPFVLKIVNNLPENLLVFFAKKFINKYVNNYAKLNIQGKENLNTIKKPTIFICNHISNSDGLILNKVLKDHDVTFVAGVKLSKNPFTNLGMKVVKTIPVTPNTADKDAIKTMVNHLKAGNNLLIFPEGTRSRKAQMIEAKRGILLIAKMTKAQIVPIGIWGSEDFMPINDTDMTSEKFYEADVFLNIGKSFILPKKEEGEDKAEYEDRAMKYIMGNIAKLIPENYRGVYTDAAKALEP